ncbi:MAG: hypothetical protein NTW21_33555 [Verrucomicrobia bacterium]|nr:hypothetical protein [Verrucomicrobiota bacterium]
MKAPPLNERGGPREEAARNSNQSRREAITASGQGKENDLAAALGVDNFPDYYHAPREKFIVRNRAGRWNPFSYSLYRKILTERGLNPKPEKGVPLSDCDLAALTVQSSNDVSEYGPLCGRNAGFIEENGTRFLVTEDMNLIEPAEGECPAVVAVIAGLFRNGENEVIGVAQMHTLLGWLQSSVVALRAGRQQQQQTLVICGPRDCGKSFFQHHIVTPCLAGRSADAKRAFLNDNQFNADLFKAEHLFLDDCRASTAIRDRLILGGHLKTHTAGASVQSLHGKCKDALNVRPWWRITISVNDDPESLMILPPLNEDIADKIILLRASRFEFPEPASTGDERARFASIIRDGLPAFIHWLLHSYKIPAAYADPRRYNIATFHHPDLKDALEGLSPEAELLDLIDLVMKVDFQHGLVWITAEKLEERIRAGDEHRANRIFTYRQACAKYLHRLSVKRPDRVEKSRTAEGNGWNLIPKPAASMEGVEGESSF